MIDLFHIVNDNVYFGIVFDILYNISGDSIHTEITRYFIGTLSFIALLSISILHRYSGFFYKNRDNLLTLGFGIGFLRNFILLIMSSVTYASTIHHMEVISTITGLPIYIHQFIPNVTSKLIVTNYLPISHALQVISMLLISIAFIRYISIESVKERLFRQRYLIFGICMSIFMCILSYISGRGIIPIDNMNDGITLDYMWHMLSASLIIYPTIILMRQSDKWIVNVVMLLFGCYFIYDLAKLVDMFVTIRSIPLIDSLRHTILNTTPMIMTWIFIKESMIRLEEQTIASKTLVDMQELFITGTSHELASPIAGMEGYLKILERQYQKTNTNIIVEDCPRSMICGKIPLVTTTLQEGIQHIKSILRIMKDYGHTKDYNEIKLYDISNLTQKCYTAIQFADTTKKIPRENFTYTDYSTSSDYMVRLSPYKYRQIIENIISNSVRALEVNKQHHPFIKITLKCMQEGCIITIVDNGIGMTPSELRNCFQKRWTTFENQGGTGLGLYLVKKYLDEMNGTIHIESIKQVGTTVRIVLPSEYFTDRRESER